MSDVKWIKIATNIFDDEKIKLIEVLPEADGMIVIWFKLLCLAGKQNNNGIFMMNDKLAYTDEMLSTIFRKPLPLVRLALGTFEQYGMIEIVDNVITLPNWDKHQNVEGLEKIREQGRLRAAKHRQNQKQLQSNVTHNVTVTQRNAIDIDIEKDIEKDILLPHTCVREDDEDELSNPTLDQVIKFVKDNNFKVNANKFYNHYNSSNWMIGNKPIKNWQSVLRAWELNAKETTTTSSTSKKPDWLIKYEEEFESTVECL